MDVLLYPLRYLALKDELGQSLYWRNWLAVFLLALLLTGLFVLTKANYFHDKGFLDRFGAISAVLTGFYIAALVGVASFSTGLPDLDKTIEVGKIYRLNDEGNKEYLTRRQYVCAMFGYLAFTSLLISVVGVIFVSVATLLPAVSDIWSVSARAVIIFAINLILAHMIVTTCHGLYYLIDRIYYKKAKILPKRK